MLAARRASQVESKAVHLIGRHEVGQCASRHSAVIATNLLGHHSVSICGPDVRVECGGCRMKGLPVCAEVLQQVTLHLLPECSCASEHAAIRVGVEYRTRSHVNDSQTPVHKGDVDGHENLGCCEYCVGVVTVWSVTGPPTHASVINAAARPQRTSLGKCGVESRVEEAVDRGTGA